MKLYRLSNNVISHSEKDVFIQGCVGGSTTEFHDIGEFFTTDNLQLIIDKINEFCGSKDNANLLINSCDENGRIDCQVLTVKPHKFNTVSQKSLDSWTNGERDLYLNDVSFTIETSTDSGLTYKMLQLPDVKGAYNNI